MSSVEMSLDAAAQPRQDLRLSQRLLAGLARSAPPFLVTALLLAGWLVHGREPYRSSSDFAYTLGLLGGILMLSLLLYPLRKRIRFLQGAGALRLWFRFHMIAGVLGPTLVLFHSTFHVRSLNAAVALASMLLVALSGLVGRFLYRRIHRGLYGSRASHTELQQALERSLQEIQSMSRLPGAAREEVEAFARLVTATPPGGWRRAAHFLSLGVRRRLAGARARRALARHAEHSGGIAPGQDDDLAGLLRNIDATLQAAQKAAQFTTYERLFSYWHTVHIPFLFLLVLTALVHVVAVHAY